MAAVVTRIYKEDEAEALLNSEIEKKPVQDAIRNDDEDNLGEYGYGFHKVEIDPKAMVDGLPYNTRIDQKFRNRYTIRQMPNNNYGVFATMDLPPGTMIMVEDPLFYTNADDNTRIDEIIDLQDSLGNPNYKGYLSLKSNYEFATKFFYRRNQHRFKQRIAKKSFNLGKRFDFLEVIDEASALGNRVLVIYLSNRFKISNNAHGILSSEPLYGVYQDASRLNHSAVANCNVDINEENPFRMFVTTNRNVGKGEEFTIRYHVDMHCGPVRNDDEAAECTDIFGYNCFCTRCIIKRQAATIPNSGDNVVDEDDDTIEIKVEVKRKFCTVM